MSRLSGITNADGTKAYFFSGDRYVRYDVPADRVDDGYPQPVADNWPGLFESVDACLNWPDGSVYFFAGDQYAKYDLASDKVADGYPLPIEGNWSGVFTEGIDAAVLWPGGECAYFFKGEEYVRFDIADDTAPDGAKPIAGNWSGLWQDGVDGAIAWTDGTPYFFKGDDYVRYDVDGDMVADGYPKAIAGAWNGLPIGSGVKPVTPTGTTSSVEDAFPAFTTTFEGRVPWMYLDIKGLVTVAVGNLVDPKSAVQGLPFVHKSDGSPATQAEVDAEWETVKADTSLAQKGHRAAEKVTALKMTEAAMDDLVKAKFRANEAFLKKDFPDVDTWPADAKLGLHSMAWALGAGFAKGWPKFTAAARTRDFRAAADQCRMQETGNPGVIKRNDADQQLFRNAAAVEEQGLDRNVLHYPATL